MAFVVLARHRSPSGVPTMAPPPDAPCCCCCADDYLFILVLIGDSGVGKSCLLLRFAVRELFASPRSRGGASSL